MMNLLKPQNNSILLNEKLTKIIHIKEPHRVVIFLFDWKEITPEFYASIFSNLNEKEVQRAKKISHLKRKREYIMARGLTRTSLSFFCYSEHSKQNLSCPNLPKPHFPLPNEWDVQENEHGKPFIANPHFNDLQFNITHTNKYLAIAITINNEIGIDLEPVRSAPLSPFPTHLFTKEELKSLKTLNNKEHGIEFAKLWTSKEAAAKCIRCGMKLDFSTIEIKSHKNGPLKIQSSNPSFNNVSLQNIMIIDAKHPHQLSIAVQSKK